jgi:hypothetical protein
MIRLLAWLSLSRTFANDKQNFDGQPILERGIRIEVVRNEARHARGDTHSGNEPY